MSDRIGKIILGNIGLNLVQLVAYKVVEDSLVLTTTGGEIILNVPADIEDAQAAWDELDAAVDTLAAELKADATGP